MHTCALWSHSVPVSVHIISDTGSDRISLQEVPTVTAEGGVSAIVKWICCIGRVGYPSIGDYTQGTTRDG